MIKNSRRLFVALLIVMVFILAISFGVQNEDALSDICFVVKGNIHEEEIHLFKNNDIYYAFLPSYAELNQITIADRSGRSQRLYLDEKCCMTMPDCSSLLFDQPYKLEIRGLVGTVIDEGTLILKKSDNIAAFSVRLIDGTIADLHDSKTNQKTGTLTVTKADGTVDFSGSFRSIGGRGNTTWGQSKKPYSLKFDADTVLLGMGATKGYNLLANACDESNLKNKLAYDAAKDLGVDYAVDSEFVDLYIDGVYQGLYLLTESVRVGSNVVDIVDLERSTQQSNQYPLDKYERFEVVEDGVYQKGFLLPNDPNDVTGGYLVEIEIPERMKDDDSGFITRGSSNFYIKSPQYASYDQVCYISELFQAVEELLSEDRVCEYIDIESWVRYYLIQEVFANTDIGSFYLCKDSDSRYGKIVAGPIWDFDFSLGTGFLGADISPTVFHTNTWGWFKRIYQNTEFQRILNELYVEEMRPLIDHIINTRINQYTAEIQASYLMNELRWKGIQWYEWDHHFDTLQDHSAYLANYLTQRKTFLDEVWIDGAEYCRLFYKCDWPLYEKHHYSVKYGTIYGELPELSYEGYNFLGYFDNDTGELYDPSSPITENKMYVAKWEPVVLPTKPSLVDSGINLLREVYYNIELYFCIALFLVIIIMAIVIIYWNNGGSRRRRNGR